jgi:hypothetical protein
MMDASAPQWLVALEASGVGAAIRQSPLLYPAANVAHVVGVAGFAGAVAVLDLVLLGVIRAHERFRLALAARRFAVGFLALVVATGLMLFVAEASHVALNPLFLVKMALLVLAGVNAFLIAGPAMDRLALIEDSQPVSRRLRVSAGLSIFVWLTIVGLGRAIAYY